MAHISNVSLFYSQQVALLPEPEVDAALRSRIFQDFVNDFPDVDAVNNKVRDLIYLQWIRFYLKNGKEETADPQIWEDERWYRSVMPKIMEAYLQEDVAVFLSKPFKEQMLVFSRLNIFYEKIMKSDCMEKFFKWKLYVLRSEPGFFPEKVRASITEYIMSPRSRTAEMEEDAEKMVKNVISFIERLQDNDGKEETE